MTGALVDSSQIHSKAILIDAVSPLMNTNPDLASWWIEGGTTAVVPTVGGFDGAAKTLENVGRWLRLIAQDPRLVQVRKAADIEQAKESNRLGIIFHFQGTTPVQDNLDLVTAFKNLGVGMIQLAYNKKNPVGDGCEERTDAGLSNFGVSLIKRMNDERVIVDCSHTGYTTTMEAIETSTAPVVVSHANVKAIKPSRRNITDDQITAIAASGGLIGAVGFPAFVSSASAPTLDELVDHIEYIVKLTSIDHVGLGIDYFDGQVGVSSQEAADKRYAGLIASGAWQPESYPPPPYVYPRGIETPRTFANLTAKLLERGFDEASVYKILGGNWIRVFRTVWGA